MAPLRIKLADPHGIFPTGVQDDDYDAFSLDPYAGFHFRKRKSLRSMA